MADNSAIEWTDATWNPATGCSVVSPGCTNCYAMRLAGNRLRHLPSRRGLTTMTKAGPVWNGKISLNHDWLDQPLRWKRPRRIFVCAHGDLFHEGVPDDFIDGVFAVMALCPHHTFQILTKRPKRMRTYMTANTEPFAVGHACGRVTDLIEANLERWGFQHTGVGPLPWGEPGAKWWPLPNVWLGVSVEDQTRADARIPELLATPAAVRFVSAEPLLGPVDLADVFTGETNVDALEGLIEANVVMRQDGSRRAIDPEYIKGPRLDWVIVGSESGPHHRPCDLDWVRSLRDQCCAAGVPFFWKQHVVNGRKLSTPELDGKRWIEFPNTGHSPSAS